MNKQSNPIINVVLLTFWLQPFGKDISKHIIPLLTCTHTHIHTINPSQAIYLVDEVNIYILCDDLYLKWQQYTLYIYRVHVYRAFPATNSIKYCTLTHKYKILFIFEAGPRPWSWWLVCCWLVVFFRWFSVAAVAPFVFIFLLLMMYVCVCVCCYSISIRQKQQNAVSLFNWNIEKYESD